MKKAVTSAKRNEQKSPAPKPEMKTASMVANPRHAYAQNRIAILDSRLGVGIGAIRERARLAKILAS